MSLLDTLSDEDLMEQWQAGDEQAGEAIFRRYRQWVRYSAGRRFSRPEVADEAAQHAWVKLVCKKATYRRERGSFRTWLGPNPNPKNDKTIVGTAFADFFRIHGPENEQILGPPMEDGEEDEFGNFVPLPDELRVNRRRDFGAPEQEAIRSAFQALKPREQSILLSSYEEEDTDTVIAGELGISSQAVGQQRKAAIKHLVQELTKRGIRLAPWVVITETPKHEPFDCDRRTEIRCEPLGWYVGLYLSVYAWIACEGSHRQEGCARLDDRPADYRFAPRQSNTYILVLTAEEPVKSIRDVNDTDSRWWLTLVRQERRWQETSKY